MKPTSNFNEFYIYSLLNLRNKSKNEQTHTKTPNKRTIAIFNAKFTPNETKKKL